jgi:hypothetical protein
LFVHTVGKSNFAGAQVMKIRILILTLMVTLISLWAAIPKAGSTNSSEIIQLKPGSLDQSTTINLPGGPEQISQKGPARQKSDDAITQPQTETKLVSGLLESPKIAAEKKSEHRTTPPKPNPATILQGGDNISDAFVISALPFSDMGTTNGYTDDYDGSCGNPYYDPDVVYSYTPSSNIKIDISTWGSFFDTRLYVFETDASNEIACNYATRYPQARIFNLELTAGTTYYIVVDGDDGSSGDYVLNVFESPAPPSNNNCADVSPELLEPGVPLIFSGNNIGATDNCNLIPGAEVWHAIYVPECMFVTIDWCGNDPIFSPVSSWLVSGCPCGTAIDADNVDWNACGDGNASVTYYNVAPGIYYIPIRWHYRNAGPYTIHVNGIPCLAYQFSCPPNAIAEGEPTCYDGYVDTYNNGCNIAPYNFSNITFGDTICGTSGNYFTNYWQMDGDNYLIELTEPKILTISAAAEFNFQIVFRVLAGSSLCEDYYSLFETDYAAYDTAINVTANLEPGSYYVRIRPSSNQGTPCGSQYWLTVGAQDAPPPPTVECPVNARQEGEPNCGPNYNDIYNAGCQDSPPQFLPIANGDTICGSGGTYLNLGYNYRDTDWYRYVQTFTGPISFFVTAQFPALIAIYDSKGEDCSRAINIGEASAGPGETAAITIEAGRGVYWLVITSTDFFGYPCPLNYVATLSGPSPILHDVSVKSIDSPTRGRLFNGHSPYPIIANLSNASSIPESFELAASDNFGYISTIPNLTMPAMSETTITFSDLYNPTTTCENVLLAVTATLADDPDPNNNSQEISLAIASPQNFTCSYDSLDLASVFIYGDPSIVEAEQYIAEYDMDIVYVGARTYAREFGDNGWPDATRDPFKLYLFLDWDGDGIPDLQPEAEGVVYPTDSPSWSYFVLPCAISVTAGQSFWVGWSNINDQFGDEALARDPELNHPTMIWKKLPNMWVQDSEGVTGDDMLRAWGMADLSNAPDISLSPSPIVGSVQATGQADSIPVIVSNTGVDTLNYHVKTVHSYNVRRSVPDNPKPIGYHPASKKSDIREPYFPPRTLRAGGPDMFGYRWIDSDEFGGPSSDWIDITTVGIHVSMGDESVRGPYALGFDFPYYDNNYSQIWVSSNGWVSFNNPGYSYYNNQPIPYSPIPNDIIAIWWDDLDPSSCGDVYYYFDGATQEFIVSFIGVCFFGDEYETVGSLNFQVVLNADGNIALNYDVMNFASYRGNRASIGIENSDGSDGIGIAYNSEYVHDNLSVLIVRPTTWISVDRQSGTLAGGMSETINVVLSATAPYADTTLAGALRFITNDPDRTVFFTPASLTIGTIGGCSYVVGDVNNSGGFNGVDVVYAVSYFKGGAAPPFSCLCGTTTWYVAGDVNASCNFNGVDVTYAVSYFKGGPVPHPCAECPPEGLLSHPTPGNETAPAVESIKNSVPKVNSVIKSAN